MTEETPTTNNSEDVSEDVVFACTVSGAHEKAYEEVWEDWTDWLFGEGAYVGMSEAAGDLGEDPTVFSNENYVRYIAQLEVSGRNTMASSIIRHVYKANGWAGSDLPPTRAGLIKSGFIVEVMRGKTQKTQKTQKTTEGDQEYESGAESGVPHLTRAGGVMRTIDPDDVAIGEFVLISGKMYRRTSSCFAGVDAHGKDIGTALPFKYLRRTNVCYLNPTFDDVMVDEVVSQVAEVLGEHSTKTGAMYFHSQREAMVAIVLAILGLNSVDEVIQEYSDPKKAGAAAAAMLLGDPPGDE